MNKYTRFYAVLLAIIIFQLSLEPKDNHIQQHKSSPDTNRLGSRITINKSGVTIYRGMIRETGAETGNR